MVCAVEIVTETEHVAELTDCLGTGGRAFLSLSRHKEQWYLIGREFVV